MTRAVHYSFVILLCLILALASVWASLALWYRLPFPAPIRLFGSGGFALLGLAVIIGQFRPRRLRALATFSLALASITTWWMTLAAPADRNWSADVARQVTGQITNQADGDILTLTDVRNFTWRSPDDYDVRWETRQYDLQQLQSVDLFMSYWSGTTIAHMIVSFGFADGDHIAWSVEVRRQQGGAFSPIADLFKSNTLAIIAADERDVIGTRTNIRGEDVRLFRTNTSPEKARALLMQYVAAANQLAQQPQWYNSLFTNCTTVVLQMIRTIGGELPLDWRALLNGHLPGYAYDAGVLDTRLPLQVLTSKGHITTGARAYGLGPAYSSIIRQGVPLPGS